MKVLIFSLAYPPFIGGAELAVKEITNRIGDIEFEMITANLDGKQLLQETISNIKIYRVGKGKLSKYLFPHLALKKAKELHQKNNYNLIWAIMANQAGLAALMFKKRFPSVKYLLTLQEGDPLKKIWAMTWFMRPVYKSIYRRADKIQAISQFLKQRALKYGHQGDIAVIPNGVDCNHFAQRISPESLNALKQEFSITQNDRVIITASRLVEKNGVDILIRALCDFKKVKLIIAGTGKLQSKLQSLASDLGIQSNVFFVGHISHQDLPRYLQIADIFIRPSRSEGLGSAFLEAMAASLPIIATPVGGIPDFLKDGQTGLFCEVNNPKDLAKKISLILDNDDLRQQLINNGRQSVLRDYDWQKISNNMKEIFQNLSQ